MSTDSPLPPEFRPARALVVFALLSALLAVGSAGSFFVVLLRTRHHGPNDAAGLADAVAAMLLQSAALAVWGARPKRVTRLHMMLTLLFVEVVRGCVELTIGEASREGCKGDDSLLATNLIAHSLPWVIGAALLVRAMARGLRARDWNEPAQLDARRFATGYAVLVLVNVCHTYATSSRAVFGGMPTGVQCIRWDPTPFVLAAASLLLSVVWARSLRARAELRRQFVRLTERGKTPGFRIVHGAAGERLLLRVDGQQLYRDSDIAAGVTIPAD